MKYETYTGFGKTFPMFSIDEFDADEYTNDGYLLLNDFIETKMYQMYGVNEGMGKISPYLKRQIDRDRKIDELLK